MDKKSISRWACIICFVIILLGFGAANLALYLTGNKYLSGGENCKVFPDSEVKYTIEQDLIGNFFRERRFIDRYPDSFLQLKCPSWLKEVEYVLWDTLVSRTETKAFSLYEEYNINDCKGDLAYRAKSGRFTKNSNYISYELFDKKGDSVAFVDGSTFFDTNINIKDSKTNEVVAIINKRSFSLTWDIERRNVQHPGANHIVIASIIGKKSLPDKDSCNSFFKTVAIVILVVVIILVIFIICRFYKWYKHRKSGVAPINANAHDQNTNNQISANTIGGTSTMPQGYIPINNVLVGKHPINQETANSIEVNRIYNEEKQKFLDAEYLNNPRPSGFIPNSQPDQFNSGTFAQMPVNGIQQGVAFNTFPNNQNYMPSYNQQVVSGQNPVYPNQNTQYSPPNQNPHPYQNPNFQIPYTQVPGAINYQAPPQNSSLPPLNTYGNGQLAAQNFTPFQPNTNIPILSEEFQPKGEESKPVFEKE